MKVFVGGREVAVNPAQYGNVTAGNAIFDSGTTFTILPGTFIPPILGLVGSAGWIARIRPTPCAVLLMPARPQL